MEKGTVWAEEKESCPETASHLCTLGGSNFWNFITEAEKTIHQVQGRQNLSHHCGRDARKYQEKQI